jgi:hypothetical protein
MEYFNEPEFQDPADWDIASYTAHPIDSIEPLPDHSTSYRDAALECMKILRSVDVFMSRATDPRLAWTTVSHTIGLASTHGLSETQIAHQLGVSEHRLHRAMNKFTRLANLDPSGGLRPLGGPPSTKTVSVGSNGSFEASGSSRRKWPGSRTAVSERTGARQTV